MDSVYMAHEQDLTDIMLLRIFQKLSHILRIYFFRSASSWVSGEKLKGIRSNLHRLFSHIKNPFDEDK